MKPRALLCAVVAAVLTGGTAARLDPAPPTVSEARVRELQSLRRGTFICWSFSKFSGKEWTPCVTGLSFFKATGCDTDQWARTATEVSRWASPESQADLSLTQFPL